MAVETGQATDYTDLMVKFNTFITSHVDLVAAGQEWVLLDTDNTTYLYKGPGLAGTEEIFMSMALVSNPVDNFYGWRCNPFRAYLPPPQSINSQGSEGIETFICMWNDIMDYWFIANGQRFIVVAKVGSTYQYGYFGKFTCYFRSGEYPYPVICHGMNDALTSYQTTDNTGIIRPHKKHGSIWTIGGIWGVMASESYDIEAEQTHQMWPYSDSGTYDSALTKLVPFDSGDRVVLPLCIVTKARTGYNIVPGELDGMVAVPGQNLTSESTLTINGDTYIMFQNGARIGTMDFMAVRMV